MNKKRNKKVRVVEYDEIAIRFNNFLKQSGYSRNYILTKVRELGSDIFEMNSNKTILLDYTETTIFNFVADKPNTKLNEYIRLVDLVKLYHTLCRNRRTQKYYDALDAIIRYKLWVSTQYKIIGIENYKILLNSQYGKNNIKEKE